MLRLILFVVLAYLVWRILESALKLTGKQNPRQGSVNNSPRTPKKAPTPPFRDIHDAEFEDLTPRKEGGGSSSTPGS